MSILIVDDDADLLDILCFALRRDGHEVLAARDGGAALKLWEQKKPRLVVLDVDLPFVNGWDVCKQIREASTTSVIMLTAASAEGDIVKGLDLGADDYIVKPFSPREFLARVRAALRRPNEVSDLPSREWRTIVAGDLTLDPLWRTVNRDQEAVHLTPIEFKLLYELVLHEGQVLTHQSLVDRVWGFDGVDDASLLKGHVRNIRRKLADESSAPIYIHTIASVGYTFRRRLGQSE